MTSIINISSYSLLLYTLFAGGNLIFIGIFFFLYFIWRKSFIDKFFITKDTILITFFAILYPIKALSDYSLNFSDIALTEWKVYIVIIILSLLSLQNENNKIIEINKTYKLGNIFSISIFIFSIFCLYQVFPAYFRFPDYAPAAAAMISNYFGFICLFAVSLIKNNIFKIILFLLAAIAGGGGSTFAVIIYLVTYFYTKSDISLIKKLQYSFISLIISFYILFPIFQYTQLQRGRSFTNLEAIDRFIIIDYVQKHIRDNFRPIDYLFGVGPDGAIDIRSLMESYSINTSEIIIGDYLVNESGDVAGKNFHNDYLRIFVHFGFLGLFIFLRYSYKLFSYDMSFYFAFLFISFFNTTASTSICASIIIIVFIFKGFFTNFNKRRNLTKKIL